MRLLFILVVGILLSAPSYALKPSKTYEAIPDTMRLPFEKNMITTSDNFKLNSWTFLPTKKVDNHTTLVLAYADAGNMSWWLMQAGALSKAGFTVVMFDYRGFGKSDAFSIYPKMLYYKEFATDLSAAMLFARTKYRGNKTGIWAFSMGTTATTLAAQTARPDFIIGDGYVTDPIKIKAFFAAKNDNVWLPAGAENYTATLQKITVPMLIFSGSKDVVTTDEDIKKLKRSNPGIQVVTFDGGHMQGFFVLSKEFTGSQYITTIKRFLKVG